MNANYVGNVRLVIIRIFKPSLFRKESLLCISYYKKKSLQCVIPSSRHQH